MIYLDCNASTPVDDDVVAAISFALRENFGNPSSCHASGVHAQQALELSRKQTAELIGASPEEIIFTSGGTESNNLAIIGLADRMKTGHAITSVTEHPSVINPFRHLEKKGFSVTYLTVDKDGKNSIDEVRDSVRKDTFLISVMHANNETGILQPIEEIGAFARQKGIPFHTDAAQTVGKIPVHLDNHPVDMMTIVSHKFYGPKGVGALYIRKGLEIRPILFGAGHEQGLRPGTENVPGIVGLGKACELARHEIRDRAAHSRRNTDLLFVLLREKFSGIRLNGHSQVRLPNTLNIMLPGIDASDLLEFLKNDVAASPGSACHAGHRKPSSVLLAMGLSESEALCSLRLSTGKDTTEEEIRAAAALIVKAAQVLRQ